MANVYVIKCNDPTQFIVDGVAYDTLEKAEQWRDAMDASGFNSVCGPHAVYPLSLRTEDDDVSGT